MNEYSSNVDTFVDYLETPIGWLEVTASDLAITSIYFVDEVKQTHPHPLTVKAKEQLSAYFAGECIAFDLPLSPKGTMFQQQVWQKLCDIPYGETCSYGELASNIDNPKAVRAVGAANGKNPISIVVPCHRVIGANGTLTGYAGGLDRKAWLLNLENTQTKLGFVESD